MSDDLQKHTLHLREGDMDYLQSTYGRGKGSLVIRRLVSNFVDNLRKKESPIDHDNIAGGNPGGNPDP